MHMLSVTTSAELAMGDRGVLVYFQLCAYAGKHASGGSTICMLLCTMVAAREGQGQGQGRGRGRTSAETEAATRQRQEQREGRKLETEKQRERQDRVCSSVGARQVTLVWYGKCVCTTAQSGPSSGTRRRDKEKEDTAAAGCDSWEADWYPVGQLYRGQERGCGTGKRECIRTRELPY